MFSLGIDKNTSSPASLSRVERFLNSPEAQTMQKAVELNAYMKLDPSAAERFDLIRALDIQSPSFDSGTVETTLKTILEKDLILGLPAILSRRE